MTLIAAIFVHQCDRCDRIVSMKDPDEVAEFLDQWFTGWEKDFCADCRDTAAAQAAIIAEERRTRAVAAIIGKYRKERDYVH